MKLTNTSPYEARLLRTLISRVHARMARLEGRLSTWAELAVIVRGRKPSTYNTGRAWLDGSRMVLTLGEDETRGVAWVIWHEFQHLYGYRHRALHDAQDDDLDALCAGLPATLPRSARSNRVRRPRPDLVAQRYARAKTHLATWQRKLRAAQRKCAAYARTVQRYEHTYDSARLSGGSGVPAPSAPSRHRSVPRDAEASADGR